MHLQVHGKGSKIRFLPAHPRALIWTGRTPFQALSPRPSLADETTEVAGDRRA